MLNTTSLHSHLVRRTLPPFLGPIAPPIRNRVVTVQTDEEIRGAMQTLDDYARGKVDDVDPILFKGVLLRAWPNACSKWSLEYFLREIPWHVVRARVAPSLTFPYVEPALLEDYAREFGRHRVRVCVCVFVVWPPPLLSKLPS